MQVTLLKKNQFIEEVKIPGDDNLSAIKDFLGEDFKEFNDNRLLYIIGGVILFRSQCKPEDSKEPTLILDDHGDPSKVIFGEILVVGKDEETGYYYDLPNIGKLLLAQSLKESGCYQVTHPVTKETSHCFTLPDISIEEQNDATS